MYNYKFTLIDGTEVFPNYMSLEQREQLRNMIGNRIEIMWCSCRNDTRLYYRLSENLRFYPEHNGYEHSPFCIRHINSDQRKTAISRSDCEGATVYLQFNPKNFSVPSMKTEEDIEEEIEDEQIQSLIQKSDNENNEIYHLKQQKVDSDKYNDPKFNLSKFVRFINLDTFTERVTNHKAILSADYFTNALFGRLKFIHISGMKKSIRSLSLEEDGVRFIYSQFIGCDIKKSSTYTSYNVLVKGFDNKTYSLFTFSSIYERALKQFHKQYGIEPNEHTMISGFQYYPKSKNNTYYKVIGRMHLFQISDHGLYCNSLLEQDCYNTIINFVKKDETICFYIPAESEHIGGILEIKGANKKGIIFFPSTKESKDFIIDNSLFVPLILEKKTNLTDELLTTFCEKIRLA